MRGVAIARANCAAARAVHLTAYLFWSSGREAAEALHVTGAPLLSPYYDTALPSTNSVASMVLPLPSSFPISGAPSLARPHHPSTSSSLAPTAYRPVRTTPLSDDRLRPCPMRTTAHICIQHMSGVNGKLHQAFIRWP
jgi:hypothetical protein